MGKIITIRDIGFIPELGEYAPISNILVTDRLYTLLKSRYTVVYNGEGQPTIRMKQYDILGGASPYRVSAPVKKYTPTEEEKKNDYAPIVDTTIEVDPETGKLEQPGIPEAVVEATEEAQKDEVKANGHLTKTMVIQMNKTKLLECLKSHGYNTADFEESTNNQMREFIYKNILHLSEY